MHIVHTPVRVQTVTSLVIEKSVAKHARAGKPVYQVSNTDGNEHTCDGGYARVVALYL